MAIDWDKVFAKAKAMESTTRNLRGTAQHKPSPVADSPLLAPVKRAQGSTYLTGGGSAPATPYAAGQQAGLVKAPERTQKPKEPKETKEAAAPAWMGLMDQTAEELARRHSAAIAERNALRDRVKQGETAVPNSTYAASAGGYRAKEVNPISGAAAASGAWMSEEDKRLLPLRMDQERKQTEINDLAAAHYYRKNQEQFAKLETDAVSKASYMSAKELTADLDTLSKALNNPSTYNGHDSRFNAAGEALAEKYGTYDLQTLQRTLTAQKAKLVEELKAKGYDFETMAGYDRMLAQQENYQRTQEQMQKDAEEHPVSMSGFSTILAPLQGLDFVKKGLDGIGRSNADDLGSYVPNNVYDMYATNMVQTIRGTVSKKIEENTDWELFGQNVASFLYNTGMSVADSALQVATLGKGATLVMGLSSAANTTKEIIERGGSNEQAFWGGLAAGTAEMVFEKFSVESILNLDFGDGWKGAVKAVLSQAGVEASEEMMTEVANILSDTMVMGERSGLVTAAKEYEAQGVSRDKAWLRATLDSLGQVAWAGAGGALSGMGMAGGKLALQRGGSAVYDHFTRRQGQTAENVTGAGVDSRLGTDAGVDTQATQNPVEGAKNAPTEGAGKSADPLMETVRKQAQKASAQNFRQAMDSWDGNSKMAFDVGRTSAALQSIGVKDQRIRLQSDKVNGILAKHPGMSKDIIKMAPDILESPVLVAKSKTHETRIVVFGEVFDTNGAPVLAALELQPTTKGGEVVDVINLSSLYGKDKNPADFIRSSDIVFLDQNENRTKAWLQSVGLQLPSDATTLGPIGSITYADGKVKVEGRAIFREVLTTNESGTPLFKSESTGNTDGPLRSDAPLGTSGDVPTMDSIPQTAKDVNLDGWAAAQNPAEGVKNAHDGVVVKSSGISALEGPESLGKTLASSIESLKDMNSVAQLTGQEMNDRAKKPSEQIRTFFSKIGSVFRKGFGEVSFGEYGIGGMLNHRPLNRAKMVTLEAVPFVIENGRVISDVADWKGRGYRSVVFGAPVTIGESKVYVAAVVNQNPEGKFYLSECVDSDGNYIRIENNPSDGTKSGVTAQGGITATPEKSFSIDNIPQTAQDVNPETGDGMPNSVGAAAAGFTGDKERGFSRNLGTDTARHEDIRHEYQVNPQMYHTLANAETLQKATDIFNQGVDRAKATLDQAIGAAQAGRKLAPEMVPLAKMTADALAQQGNMVEAERILSAVGAELTQAGQLGQAAKILRDASPATKAQAIQNIVDEINKKVKKADIQVDEDLLTQYAAETDENTANAILDQIYQNIADQIPPTLVERWNALRYLNMLGNLKTQVRNIAGNVAGGVTRAVKDRIAAGIEAVAYKASGGKYERTKSVGYDPALYKAARQDFESVKSQALGEGKYSDHAVAMKDIQDRRRIFQSNFKDAKVKGAVDTLLAPLEGYRKVTNWAMEEGDAIFSKVNYADALAQWLTAHKITAEMWTGGKVDADTMDKARAYAIREAQRATYRDNNVFSDTISKFRFRNPENRAQRAVNVMLQGVLPFRRTPANVAVRMVEYSPLGMVETAFKTVELKRGKGNVTGADVVDSLAATLTGTGLFLLGMGLMHSGAAKGGADEDEERDRLDDLTGRQDYAIELSDGTSITFDWLSPTSTPIAMGMEFERIRAEKGLSVNAAVEAAKSFTDTLINSSMLQGVNQMLDSTKYSEDNALVELALDSLLSYVTQGTTSTMLAQAERTGETERMTTFVDRNSGVGKGTQRALGQASAKTPGLDYNQIPYIDAWGRHEETGSVWIRALNNFANPAYVSKKNETAADKEIKRLLDAGQTGVVPKRPAQSDKINNEYLTAEEYVSYAETKGQLSFRMVSELIQSDAYKGMSDADKAKAISEAYSCATALAKNEVKPGYEIPSQYKKAQTAQGAGVLADYYFYKLKLKEDSDKRGNKTASEALRRELFADKSLTAKQKQTLDELLISDNVILQKDVVVDYSDQESFTITQMSEGAQKKWSRAQELGYTAQEYKTYYRIYAQQGKKKDEKLKELEAAGLSRREAKAFWKAMGEEE